MRYLFSYLVVLFLIISSSFAIESKIVLKIDNKIITNLDIKKEDKFGLDYSFASEDGFSSFKYHDIGINFSLNNFVTEFNFIEENDLAGTAHIIENASTFNFDENNLISFKTRKNKEINLTEYYDLIYEYKNDCLVAGLRFQKKYYEDRDLKPSENLFFSITLFPLTTLEQEIDQNLYNQN